MKRSLIFVIVLLAMLLVLLACQPATPAPKPTTTPEPPDPKAAFAQGAFPPTIPDREWHNNAWLLTDCLACHGKDTQGEAPKIVHKDLPELYLNVNCRTCHVPRPPE